MEQILWALELLMPLPLMWFGSYLLLMEPQDKFFQPMEVEF